MWNVKLPEIWENLYDLGYGDDFLDIPPKAWYIEKIDKLDFIKINNLWKREWKSAKRMKEQDAVWEKILAKGRW